MKDHRSTEELLEIVGPSRASYAAEAVAAAEGELRSRTGTEQELFTAKGRKIGTVCAWLGGLFVIWGLVFIPIGLSFLSDREPVTAESSFLFMHFDVVFVGGAALEALAGALLLMGGMGFRKRRERGRRLILVVLWIAVLYVVVFTSGMVVSLYQLASGGLRLGMAVVSVLMAGAWCLLLWLPIRYFRSPRVRQLCQA